MAKPVRPILKLALQTVLARTGLFWVALIVPTLIFWFLGPEGESSWIAPILLAAGLGLLIVGLKDRADHAAMERLARGDAPRNGQWSAVHGWAIALETSDDPTENQILACRFQSYDRYLNKEGEKRYSLRYDGFFLAPTGVENNGTTTRLMGFPDLLHTEKEGLTSDILTRAKAAAAPNPAYLPTFLAREFVLSRRDDRFEESISYGNAEPNSTEGKLDCWILRAGDEVCVFGHWRDGALYPSYRRGRGLPVYEGSIEAVLADLRGTAKGFLIAGGAFLILAFGLAVWSLL